MDSYLNKISNELSKNNIQNIGIFIINEKQIIFNETLEEIYLQSNEQTNCLIPNGALNIEAKSKLYYKI